MTTVLERTSSVIATSGFLLRLSRDRSLPDAIRNEASQLLRHYPTPEAVSLAGRYEAIRQDQVAKLPGSPKALHPVLATWPLLEPFFCESILQDAPEASIPPDFSTTTLRFTPRIKSDGVVAGFQILGPAASTGMGCLSIEYQCFTSARAQVLTCATVVFGSPTRASDWFVSRIRSLDKQQPCTMMHSAHEFHMVIDTLFRIEHGFY